MVFAQRPDHLLSLDEWSRLDLDPEQRYELVRGEVVVVPRPTFFHQHALQEVGAQLRARPSPSPPPCSSTASTRSLPRTPAG